MCQGGATAKLSWVKYYERLRKLAATFSSLHRDVDRERKSFPFLRVRSSVVLFVQQWNSTEDQFCCSDLCEWEKQIPASCASDFGEGFYFVLFCFSLQLLSVKLKVVALKTSDCNSIFSETSFART